MKLKCIFFSILLLICFNTNAQGDLQFNKVKLVSSIDSVPIGKVWKVESLLLADSCTNFAFIDIIINGRPIALYFNYTSIGSQLNYTKLPFWLPEGTTLQSGCGPLSLIEYNIIH